VRRAPSRAGGSGGGSVDKGDDEMMPRQDRMNDDPTAQLSPTARRLVAAARTLLARGGFEALTVEGVAAEAGA